MMYHVIIDWEGGRRARLPAYVPLPQASAGQAQALRGA
jgi:hypothetical protein